MTYNLLEYCTSDDLLLEVSQLSSVKRMKATVKSSIKYGALVGMSTVVCGLLAGPAGLAIGGIVSSCIASVTALDEFQSVPNILMNATPKEKEKLAKVLIRLLKSKHITTLSDLVVTASRDKSVEEAIVQALVMFLVNELRMSVTT